MKRLKRFAKSN